MAGGKETPRQAMIGLMYLVLTALLALQVSSSIIDKFLFLNSSLEHSLQESTQINDATMAALEKKVAEEGNTNKGKAALEKGIRIREDVKNMKTYLDGIKAELIKAGGGPGENGALVKNPGEETTVEVLMLGPEGSKKGKGYEVEQKLNAFTDRMNNEIKDLGMPKLAFGNQNNPLYKGDAVQRNKDFAQASFGQTPVAAALAVVTQKQSEILRYEAEALKKLGAESELPLPKFDKLIAYASPKSDVVSNGTKYRAEMFIAASSSNLVPKMSYNGTPVPVKDGIGIVEFTATGGSMQGTKQKWRGQIAVPIKGKDSIFVLEKEYTVVSPVMVIQSDAVQALYEGCGNELNVSVPALGEAYNPVFGVSNAQSIPGAKKGSIIVIPNMGAKEVSLSVSSGGQAIGTEKIRVRPVPLPSIAIFSGAARLDPSKAVRAPRVLSVKAVPDEGFAAFLPKEANYRVNQWKLTLASGPRAAMVKNYTSSDANTADVAGAARPGDVYYIEVFNVTRTNFRGASLPTRVVGGALSLKIQ